MRHVTTELIEHPEDDVLAHLEVCARCRALVTTDVDLSAVRRRVLDEAAGIQMATRSPAGAVSRWRERPWAVVAVAATAVLALSIPLAWMGRQTGGDVAGPGPGVSGTDVPVVELPVRHPEPRPEDIAPPAPGAAGDVASFEMSFVVGDAVIGRLIWQDETFYELVRANLTADVPVFDYQMYRAGDNTGGEDFGEAAASARPEGPRQPSDPEIPWGLLIERHSDDEMWSAVAGDGVDAVTVDPTHPDARRAWANAGARLEVTDDGVPVIVERQGHERFEVVSLDRRPIRTGEVGNNADLPFNYALFLSPTTSGEQRPVLANGIVTFADYRTAAEAAALCAGVEAEFDSSAGMYVFPDDETATGCTARYVDDIAAVWRLDSQWIDESEWTAIWYTVEGDLASAEMYRAEEGQERALASGDGWAISISSRGDGYCTRESAARSSAEGCFLPSQMLIPDILSIGVGLTLDESRQPTEGHMMGVVTEDADRVVVRFSHGGELEIIPGDIVEFGFRGYGTLFDAADLGEPTEVEIYGGMMSLGAKTLDVYAER